MTDLEIEHRLDTVVGELQSIRSQIDEVADGELDELMSYALAHLRYALKVLRD